MLGFKELLFFLFAPNPPSFPPLSLAHFPLRALQLQDLLKKARIFVPKSRWMLGTVDESGILKVWTLGVFRVFRVLGFFILDSLSYTIFYHFRDNFPSPTLYLRPFFMFSTFSTVYSLFSTQIFLPTPLQFSSISPTYFRVFSVFSVLRISQVLGFLGFLRILRTLRIFQNLLGFQGFQGVLTFPLSSHLNLPLTSPLFP